MAEDIDVLKYELRPFVKRSATTALGLATTVVDNTLTEPNDFWNGMAILIRTGACAGQLRRVLDWDLATTTLTVNVAFTAPIVAGVQYVMFFPTILQVNVAPGGGLKADLQQVLGQGADIAPGNELLTQDTGLNTNPRRYEKENGFTSAVVARAGGVATPLWAVGLAAVYPAAGRTAGRISTIYTLTIENATGAAVTAWLEIGGVAITVPFHIANNDSVVIDYVAGKNVGDNNVNCNASANGVIFQIMGTEA